MTTFLSFLLSGMRKSTAYALILALLIPQAIMDRRDTTSCGAGPQLGKGMVAQSVADHIILTLRGRLFRSAQKVDEEFSFNDRGNTAVEYQPKSKDDDISK